MNELLDILNVLLGAEAALKPKKFLTEDITLAYYKVREAKALVKSSLMDTQKANNPKEGDGPEIEFIPA